MSLKGYQWLNDKQEVVMSFTFKDLQIDVWKDTTQEEYLKFFDFIRKNGWQPISTDCHFHKVEDKEMK